MNAFVTLSVKEMLYNKTVNKTNE